MTEKPHHDPDPIHYEASTYRMDESIGLLLSRLKSAFVAALDQELQGLDLTAPQWVTLMRIANHCGGTATDLCRDFPYDSGSMTRMLDRLEEKGFIHRERSTEDRRVVQIRLTEQGEALLPQLREKGAAMHNRHLKGFTREEVAQLKSLLRRMLANAG
ncbi:MAG: MarR family transcriptional regulator [Candidatus Dactylopiibacterium carminicum]|uniref:MarR family transcriptional regulator n=1 Tax=Candidatus Dactylopiibacterium carminicum TaxID=857335 RepID=A0A272EVZ6_9RHOO|nr:MarR family transcriptional regulator [Candidatus Dactylopiibacterium carminicum]KAF7599518.1 MarR family transcriptional regulator [Candidatus Dactylopiibacterium carminicum]PAS94288.1 MAG: MarR family transcriptional regulator [Candidatus Dactylopiibacterium carminicum]PAS99523.1 MAG: hypothetical protein BSR46_07565 [Candidatus Dactylopiibacterium carminicum]